MLHTPDASHLRCCIGRSVACVDRIGNGTYDVAAASYGKPLLLYEMTDAMRGEIRDIAE
jgi:hypothetical protein